MAKDLKNNQRKTAGRIYITHCSAKKDESLAGTYIKVPPDKLYTSTRIRGFMNECMRKGVTWAIFSDNYGVWFPEEHHGYYDKSPNSVSDPEFNQLVQNFEEKLSKYQEIFFYHNPGRFHPLYKRLIREVSIRYCIIMFTHKNEISRD